MKTKLWMMFLGILAGYVDKVVWNQIMLKALRMGMWRF